MFVGMSVQETKDAERVKGRGEDDWKLVGKNEEMWAGDTVSIGTTHGSEQPSDCGTNKNGLLRDEKPPTFGAMNAKQCEAGDCKK